jgi:hypothetical protein
MEVAVVAGLFAKGNMKVDSRHVQSKVKKIGVEIWK